MGNQEDHDKVREYIHKYLQSQQALIKETQVTMLLLLECGRGWAVPFCVGFDVIPGFLSS
jgi:hypothetical protein